MKMDIDLDTLKLRATEFGGRFHKTGIVGDNWFWFNERSWCKEFAKVCSARGLSFEVCPNVYTAKYWLIIWDESVD